MSAAALRMRSGGLARTAPPEIAAESQKQADDMRRRVEAELQA